MPIPLTLKIFKGEALVGSRGFNLDVIKIGRLAAANLSLDDERVSRIHSVIDAGSGSEISILDMGSVEGTYVNGKRVDKSVLVAGDEIRLGDTRLVLSLGNAEPDIGSVTDHLDVTQLEASSPTDTPPPLAPLPKLAEIELPIAPTAPKAPERPAVVSRQVDAAGAEDGVEVRVFWGETLLESTFQAHPKVILIGESEGCDFQIPGQGLPVAEFPIVQTVGGVANLVFTDSMDGEVETPGEAPRRLRDLLKSGAAVSQGPVPGTSSIPLPLGSFAWVALATVRVEVSVKPIPRRVVAPIWQGLDYAFMNLLLVFAFSMLAFVIPAATLPMDTDTIADDLFRNPTALAKFIVRPPDKKKDAWLDRLKGESAQQKAGAKHDKGDEGAASKKNALKRNARSAPKAIDVNAKDVVKNSGLMRLLGGAESGLATILGTGGLGGDLKGAMGHLTGPAVGDAAGLGGLGLRGTGVSGGFGNTIGVGDIGTKGRAGGLGGYGVGVGTLGRKGGSDIGITSGNPTVEGSLDKELIRRVIHSHASQVRFCYESELIRHPGMNGKVAVKFIISASGAVQRANVDQSTIGNANVESCIVSRVYQWQFPRPRGGGIVVVNYPFLLKASGD